MNFKTFITEGVLQKEFYIVIDSKSIKVIRDKHLLIKRVNSFIEKDGSMSKRKYSIILNKAFELLDNIKILTITWTNNNRNYGLSIDNFGDKIIIFGAIMKSKTNYANLYSKAKRRIHLGDINFE